jgi:hypothetical protein
MEPLASYGACIRGRRYDLAVYEDNRGYFLRIYDGRARDIVPPVYLDPAAHGGGGTGAWSGPMWRGWLRDGAERLLFRVGVLRLALSPEGDAPLEAPAPLSRAG